MTTISPSLTENHNRIAVAAETNCRMQSQALQSCLYEGTVHHLRLTPTKHEFSYRINMFCLNLEEIDEIFCIPRLFSTSKWSLIQFRRSDYHGSADRPLADCVRETVWEKAGIDVDGPIRILTNPRYLGFICNPVSFYYCYNHNGSQLEVVLAEVTNTPWGERHSYIIPWSSIQKTQLLECDKQFHVSPFMPMDLTYHWRMSEPGESLAVQIENHNMNGKLFKASLSLERREISAGNVLSTTVCCPWMTAKVFAAIYWQAFKLWWKKVPFYNHPNKLQGT